MDKTREADLAILRRLWPYAGPYERQLIEDCADKILHEDKRIKAMRESLLKAHRGRELNEIKDIHDYIGNKSWYKNGQ